VRPDLWDQGTAKSLMGPTVDLLTSSAITHAGLFTFAHSPKHLSLYQRFGFWPRFLTAVMRKPAVRPPAAPTWRRLGRLSPNEREAAIRECALLTEALGPGLDLRPEIQAIETHDLGLTALLEGNSGLNGVAVCHVGAGTEGGGDTLYAKFAAVRPGPGSAATFEAMLDSIEDAALASGAGQVEVGVSTGCADAYRQLLSRGYRATMLGVTMHRPNEAGYHRPGLFVVDDWR
jgi:hypothetical protein